MATVAQAISCPRPITKAAGGIVLLIHGTGCDATSSWKGGPYLDLLPGLGPGYDVCMIDLPNRALSDAQVSSEYVARAVQLLSQKSSTGRVHLVAHSQGNLNVQWAMTFWPSIRRRVATYTSLAGDFKGTTVGPLLCVVQGLFGPSCIESVWQQLPTSHFLRTLRNAGGWWAYVPTLSLRTDNDEIIAPEIGPAVNTTSYLYGASNVRMQDICGEQYYVEHLGMPFNPAAFQAAYQTIKTGRPVSMLDVSKEICKNDTLSVMPAFLNSSMLDAISILGGGPRSKTEPKIAAYALLHDQ